MKTNGDVSETITCDLYLMDNATLLPTGASLGQASIAGISNSAYAEKTFTFATPITVNSSNNYVFVLESADNAGDGIHAKYHAAPFGNYLSGQMVRYQAAWLALGISTDLEFKVYCKYTDYKLSVGTSTNSLTFNSQFLAATNSFIIRRTDVPDTFSKIEYDELTFVQNGVNMSRYANTGVNFYSAKNLSIGTLTYCAIAPIGSSTNDVLNAGTGLQVTEGRNSNTMKFTDEGFFVSNSIGSSSSKQTVYCNALSACSLPSTDNALDKLNLIPEPKLKQHLKNPNKAHFEHSNPNKKRKYFDIDDMPDEVKFTNNEGEQDIELIRVIGFCFEAIKELNEEIKQLKKKIK